MIRGPKDSIEASFILRKTQLTSITRSAGVPQVILPVWGDTYDFAKRVEWLGIGKFGSWNNAPQCSARELGPILEQVVLSSQAAKMKEKAIELADICHRDGGGRHTAANKILDMLK